MRRIALWWLGILIVVMLASPVLEAQWVMVARSASKRIRQMKQTDASGSGFDVATVMLEAPADRVYETALGEIRRHCDLKVTKTDAASHKIEFMAGPRSASMMANSLGPKATELVVAATVSSDSTSTTWQVVNGVMKVCKQMKVECRTEN